MSGERRKENKFIVYTDIVGHTKLFTRVGAAFRKMRERHDELFNLAIKQFAPASVVKGTGDGFYAAVDDVEAALSIALVFRSALAAEQWDAYLPAERRTPDNHIRSRVGVHNGLVTLVGPEGRPNDVDGQARTVSERVMSMAQGNQVLVSRQVVDAARATGAVKSTMRLERFGEYKLREIPDTVEIWAVGDEEHAPGPKPQQPPEHRVILFAVIADCAAISSALGTKFDAMKEAWDTLFARAAGEHGRETFVKRLPDGSLAAFRNAVEAVRAARDFRRMFKNDVKESDNKLEPILAMDCGLVTFDYADSQPVDVRDQPVNIPAKMCKTGIVGKWQLLMSRAVRDDAWANLPEREEFKWVCIGRKTVPGEAEPLEIWEFQDVRTRDEVRTIVWIDARTAKQTLSTSADSYSQFEARLGELVIAARSKRAEEPLYLPHDTGLAVAFRDPIEGVLFAKDLKEEAQNTAWERLVPGLKRSGRNDNLLRLSLNMGGLRTTELDGQLKEFKGPAVDGLKPIIELARNSQVLLTRELKDAVAAGFQEGEVVWKRLETGAAGAEAYELRPPSKQRVLKFAAVGALAVAVLVGVLFATGIIPTGGGINFGERDFGELPTAIGDGVRDLESRGDVDLARVLRRLTDTLKAQDAVLARDGVPKPNRNQMLLESWKKMESMVRQKWQNVSVPTLLAEHEPGLKDVKNLADIDKWLEGVDQYVRLPADQDPRRKLEWEAQIKPLVDQFQAGGKMDGEVGKKLARLQEQIAALAARPWIPKYQQVIADESRTVAESLAESSELMVAVRNELRAGDIERQKLEQRVREEMARLTATSKVPPDVMYQALMARGSGSAAISAIGEKAQAVLSEYAEANAAKTMDQRAAELEPIRKLLKAIQEDQASIVIDALQAEHVPGLKDARTVEQLQQWLAGVENYRRFDGPDPRLTAEWINAAVDLRTRGQSEGALTEALAKLLDDFEAEVNALKSLTLTRLKAPEIKAKAEAVAAKLTPTGAVRKPIEDAIEAKRRERQGMVDAAARQRAERERLTNEIDAILGTVPAGSGEIAVLSDAWADAKAGYQVEKSKEGADLAKLKAEIARVFEGIGAMAAAFKPAVAVADNMTWARDVAAAANSKRDGSLRQLLGAMQAKPPPATAAFATSVKSAGEAHGRAVEQVMALISLWTPVEAALDKGFTLDEAASGKTVKELAASAEAHPLMQDKAFADAVKPITERLAGLKVLASVKSIEELRSLARSARRDTPELVVGVWQRLDDPSIVGDAWLDAQQDVYQLLSTLGGSVPADRKSQINTSAKAALPGRWIAYFRTLSDGGAIVQAMSRRGDFHVSDGDYAKLPPAAKFNWRLSVLKDAVKGAESEEKDAAVRKAVEQMVAEPWGELEKTEPVKSTLEGLRAVLAGKTVVNGANQVADADPSLIGPAVVADGWKFVGLKGDVYSYEMIAPEGGFKGGVAPRLEFVRLTTPGPDGKTNTFYLCTTEVSLRLVIEVVDKARAWGKLRGAYTNEPDFLLPFVWSWPSGRESAMVLRDEADPRTGKRSWLDPVSKVPILATKSYYPPDVDPGEPSLDTPMQYVTPSAAAFIARLINCRLPSSGEWIAAVAAEPNGRSIEGWNLRDQTFQKTSEHFRKSGLGTVTAPDTRSVDVPTSERRPYDHNDGVMWFANVEKDGGSPRKFHHLVGNVAEMVFEKPERFDGMRIGALDAVLAVIDAPENKASLMVIGGSALSARLDPDTLFKPQPVRAGAQRRLAQNGCADLGFRLAFTPIVSGGQDLSQAQKFGAVIEPAAYAPPKPGA